VNIISAIYDGKRKVITTPFTLLFGLIAVSPVSGGFQNTTSSLQEVISPQAANTIQETPPAQTTPSAVGLKAVEMPPATQSIVAQPSKIDSYTCNCKKTCTQITSCAEAQYQLNTCGCNQRDADHDGIACDGIPLHCQN